MKARPRDANSASSRPVIGRDARDGSGAMFDGIAGRYDLLNRIVSLGLDQGWRRRTARALALAPGHRVLDLATGTCDLAVAILQVQPDVTVVGLDPSPAMLALGRRKLESRGLSARAVLEVGMAEALPFAPASFDAVSMAFGIRNVTDRPRALAEIARVARPGAHVAILELTEPESSLARLHVRQVVPRLGALLSRGSSYGYLARSITAFPPPAAFVALLAAAGLQPIEATSLSFGAVHLFTARATP